MEHSECRFIVSNNKWCYLWKGKSCPTKHYGTYKILEKIQGEERTKKQGENINMHFIQSNN